MFISAPSVSSPLPSGNDRGPDRVPVVPTDGFAAGGQGRVQKFRTFAPAERRYSRAAEPSGQNASDMLADQTVEEQKKLDLRWTLSNALSALRMLLVIPAAFTLSSGMRVETIGIFILATITDILDGYLARRLNEVSDLGKILDPLADKIFIGVVVAVMLMEGMLPLWFVALVIGRDLAIFAGGIMIERKTGVVLPSNYPGKIAVLILSATLLLIVAGAGESVTTAMMWLSLALLAVSLLLYLRRGAAAWNGRSV